MKVIRSCGLADGRPMFNGQYLESYDPEALDGMGDWIWTPNKSEAFLFTDAAEAMDLWRQTSKTRPLRPDGKPNRPLTAFNIVIEEA